MWSALASPFSCRAWGVEPPGSCDIGMHYLTNEIAPSYDNVEYVGEASKCNVRSPGLP